MAEYPVMSTSQGTYVRIEQTSEEIRETYKMGGGGTRTGIENRCIRTTLINFFDPLQMLTTVYYSMWWVLF